MPLAVNTAVCATAISVLWGVGCALSIALRPQEHIPILHDEFLMECMTHPQMICLVISLKRTACESITTKHLVRHVAP